MTEAPTEEDLAALRRRLYAQGATEDDRRRYLAALDAAAPAAEPEPVKAPVRPRRLRMLGAAALAVVVAGGVVLALVPRPAARPDAAAAGGPTTVEQDVDSGAVVGTSAPDDSAPGTLGLSVDGVATVAQRFRGAGSTAVELDTAAAPARGGSLYVVLRASGSARISWQAVRPASAANGASFEQVIAMSDPGQEADGTPSTSTYDDDPPTRIVVSQTGFRPWSLTVAFLPRTMPELR